MANPSLGWQSWSPPTPHWSRLPRRDYPPRPYFELPLPPINAPRVSLTYWCTWYALGYWPRPADILAQAEFIQKHHLPISHILLDDGWQLSWLPQVTKTLHKMGFKVGLWYAPFTRHRQLPLYQTLDQLISLGELDLFKLDFLYKPYFLPSHYPYPSLTLQELFTFLESQFPALTTIGCGVPFSDAAGHLTVIRLSKDTALPHPVPPWFNRIFYLNRLELLSKKYAIWEKLNSFVPDPDVRMFNLDTVATDLLWSKMRFTVRGIGDDLTSLSPEQVDKVAVWLK